MTSLNRTLAAISAAGFLAAAGPAMAASEGAVNTPPVQTVQSDGQQVPQANGEIESDFSDEILTAYVAAAQSVGEVLRGYQTKMQNATSQEEAKAIQQEARDVALEKIEATPGMDLETYKQVSQAARSDPDLMQKLRDMASAQQ